MPRATIDHRALNIAKDLHQIADAEQTILFGSRAAGITGPTRTWTF